MDLSISEDYQVIITGCRDHMAISGLEKCQATFAADHRALYSRFYPELTNERWSGALCCGLLRDYIRDGVVILRAVAIETGQVAGYISCSLFPRCEDVKNGRATPSTPGSHPRHTNGEAFASRPDAMHSMNSLDGHGRTRFDISGEHAREASCSRGMFDAPDDGADENEPHAKINHIIVLPAHRGRGVGRLLFHSLVLHLEKVAPLAAVDLQIVSVELNTHAMKWYWRLGFVLVQLYLDEFATKNGKCPVLYCRMRRHKQIQYVPKGQFFAEEIVKEQLRMLPPIVPSASSEPPQKRLRLADEASPQDTDSLQPVVKIESYDKISGCHKLSDGRSLDLTDAFSRGRIRFELPLHRVIGRNGETQWPSAVAAQVYEARARVFGRARLKENVSDTPAMRSNDNANVRNNASPAVNRNRPMTSPAVGRPSARPALSSVGSVGSHVNGRTSASPAMSSVGRTHVPSAPSSVGSVGSHGSQRSMGSLGSALNGRASTNGVTVNGASTTSLPSQDSRNNPLKSASGSVLRRLRKKTASYLYYKDAIALLEKQSGVKYQPDHEAP